MNYKLIEIKQFNENLSDNLENYNKKFIKFTKKEIQKIFRDCKKIQ